MADQSRIKIRVRDTDNIIYEGEVERISSHNEVGPFDVFPMHANFISIIRKELILYNNKAKVKELKIEQAVIKVKKDIVHIFLGIEAFSYDEDEKNPSKTPQNTSAPTK